MTRVPLDQCNELSRRVGDLLDSRYGLAGNNGASIVSADPWGHSPSRRESSGRDSVLFVINPALKAESFSSAILYGALFGFFTYATYDLTNYATLRNWTMQLALVDAAWGTFLGAATSAVAFLLASKLTGSA